MNYDVTYEDIVVSGLVPNLQPHGDLQYLGNGWYKQVSTGIGYLFMRNEDGTISVKETRQSKDKPKEPKLPKAPKPPKVTKVVIQCVDCGKDREINIQDRFQVKRCQECQRKFRNARRSEAAKRKRADKLAQRDNAGTK